MDKILEIKSLFAGYQDKIVLNNINLVIYEKDFLGLIGPNGGGKTTLIKVILGLLRPFSGTIKFFNNKEKKIKKGDYLVCYISKRSKFVGILEIASEVYYDESQIWDTGIFPVRFNVHSVYAHNIRDGIHISQIRDRLSIFKKLKNKEKWGGFFINSFNPFSSDDGQIICKELKNI